MISINPFTEISTFIPAIAMQGYLVTMFILVIGATLFDVVHKKSAKYFFNNSVKAKKSATRNVGSSEKVSIAFKTATNEVLTSSEFCSTKRRLAHLLTMYGFLIFVTATVAMIFLYSSPTSMTPSIWPLAWHLGAAMLCIGGYWFWFFIRVDVSAEGNSPFRLIRADLFVVSLTLSTTFALVWAYTQANGSATWSVLTLILYIFTTTILFGSVPWSKFSHMFFKPAAAMEKKMSEASGSRNNLPEPADRTDPAVRDSHSMQLLKDAPLSMGLGIKREKPSHY